MIYKCKTCGGALPADMTKECPVCHPTPAATPSPMGWPPDTSKPIASLVMLKDGWVLTRDVVGSVMWHPKIWSQISGRTNRDPLAT